MTHFASRTIPNELRDNSHSTVSWRANTLERSPVHLVLVMNAPQRAVCGAVLRFAADRAIAFDADGVISCGQCLAFLARRYGA